MNKSCLISLLLVAATAFNANAAPPEVPLTVTIRGDGAVTSDRVGINCPTDCDEAYKKNTKITLTATANSNSSFLGWGDGACSGTTPTCAIRIKKPLVVTALFDTSAVVYPAPVSPDAELIRARMEILLDYLDSSGYAQMLPFDEHVVLVYQHAQNRPPTPLEFYLLTRLHEQIGLTRSAALSVALRGERLRPTLEQCLEFLARVDMEDFRSDAGIRQRARELAHVSPNELLKALEPADSAVPVPSARMPGKKPPPEPTPFNVYFGYLHAHSELSDGEGSPLEAYTYAHEQGQLDFFALTDHGEQLDIWPWEEKWDKLRGAAEQTYQPGIYATLWGFEWSSPAEGHISVINSTDYTSVWDSSSLADFYAWVAGRQGAFARFNHPGEYDDLGIEFQHLALDSEVRAQMVGIETWNGNDGFDVYYYAGSWSDSYSFWDVGNRNGWQLGALGGQDNHHRDWGTLNAFRTAVQAAELTREAVVDAYRDRRFYATEDRDLYLDFRCQGHPMGSRLANVARVFEVIACDASGDLFREVRFYRNGDLRDSRLVFDSVLDPQHYFGNWDLPASGCIRAVFSDAAATDADYYYVIVQQDDDFDGNGRNDEAISSPIWVEGTAKPGRRP